jgi:hypothetical protein
MTAVTIGSRVFSRWAHLERALAYLTAQTFHRGASRDHVGRAIPRRG